MPSDLLANEGNLSGFSVVMFGAKGDGQTKDTSSVQKAIDAAAEVGGGAILFPRGVYLCGSLHLKSGVTLHLEAGSVILGSPDNADYDPYEDLGFKNDSDDETSFFHCALIWGEDVENIGIVGRGVVDGNREKRHGPKPIALKRCRYVDIQGITIRNAPNYCISMLGTDYVNIDGVTIHRAHCDGIDPDCCRHVRISNCHIESWDDAIVPKASFSLGERRSTEYITVTNCQLATACNCFKLGTESGGDFKYITVSNCVMFKVPEYGVGSAGIALESVDGSNIDGVAISNISMVDIESPIFLRLGNRGRDMEVPTPGTLRNVIISNVVATNAVVPSSITGIPDHRIEGVTLSDIRLTYAGGGTEDQARIEVPEVIAKYPDADMFKGLPAYGLYVRHVDGLKLRNVQFLNARDDLRHALVCDDVHHLEVDSLTAQAFPGSASLIRFNNVADAFLKGCMAPEGTGTFLGVEGKDSNRISLIGNDLSRAAKVFDPGAETDAKAVTLIGNGAH
jgi:hypothetical protein